MKHTILFLFCISLLAGCSHPRHETLVYYVPVETTTQIPTVSEPTQIPAVPNQTAAPQTVTPVPSQTVIHQAPVNITTLYPAPLPYTGTVTTYYTPVPQLHLFLGPSFGFYHHRHHYRPYRGFRPYRGPHGRWH